MGMKEAILISVQRFNSDHKVIQGHQYYKYNMKGDGDYHTFEQVQVQNVYWHFTGLLEIFDPVSSLTDDCHVEDYKKNEKHGLENKIN